MNKNKENRLTEIETEFDSLLPYWKKAFASGNKSELKKIDDKMEKLHDEYLKNLPPVEPRSGLLTTEIIEKYFNVIK